MAPGYACPVCDVNEADAVHLANHLAVTASLGREDHLAWLEEYAPDWADCGPEELGERVAGFAREVETPAGAGDGSHAHDHGHGSQRDGPALERALARQGRQPGRGAAGADETTRVLEEARELTRRMTAETVGDGERERERASEGDDERANGTHDRESENASENE